MCIKRYILILSLLLSTIFAVAQITGDYRTTKAGDWQDVTVWQIYRNGTYVAAGTYPDAPDATVKVLHAIALGNSLTINLSRIVLTDATLTINSTGTFTASNVNVETTGNIQVNAGGTANFTTLCLGTTNPANSSLLVATGASVSFAADPTGYGALTVAAGAHVTITGGGINRNTPASPRGIRSLSAAANYRLHGDNVFFSSALPDVFTGSLEIFNPNTLVPTWEQSDSHGSNTGLKLDRDITVNAPGSITVQEHGVLNFSNFNLLGTGNFKVEGKGVLVINSPQGIAASGSSGCVRVTGSRIFPSDAIYLYYGNYPQELGSGLPGVLSGILHVSGVADYGTKGKILSQDLVLEGGKIIISGIENLFNLKARISGTGSLAMTQRSILGLASPVGLDFDSPESNIGPGITFSSAYFAFTGEDKQIIGKSLPDNVELFLKNPGGVIFNRPYQAKAIFFIHGKGILSPGIPLKVTSYSEAFDYWDGDRSVLTGGLNTEFELAGILPTAAVYFPLIEDGIGKLTVTQGTLYTYDSFTIHRELNLTGGLFYIANADVTMAPNAVVTAAKDNHVVTETSSNYVANNDNRSGYFMQTIPAHSTLVYPVGAISGGYATTSISNSSNAPVQVKLKVIAGMLKNPQARYSAGTNPYIESAIDKTWLIGAASAASLQATLSWKDADAHSAGKYNPEKRELFTYKSDWVPVLSATRISRNSNTGDNQATYSFTPFPNSIEYVAAASQTPEYPVGVTPVTLPVELISFGAAAKNNEVLLSWTTATETDNSYFEIQRSRDGLQFLPVGRVKGAGNSLVQNTYRYIDNRELPDGILYYRLKQVDFSGTCSFSPIKALKLDRREVTGGAYPQPMSNEVFIPFTGTGSVIIELFNQNSQLLQTEKQEPRGSALKLDTSKLSKGFYLVRLKHSGGIHAVKLIK